MWMPLFSLCMCDVITQIVQLGSGNDMGMPISVRTSVWVSGIKRSLDIRRFSST